MLIVTAALTVLAVGCAQRIETDGAAGGPIGQQRSCDGGTEPLAELLRTGMPTYDYQPVADLAELVALVDRVIVGTLLSAQRVPAEAGDGGEFLTQLQPAEGQVIWPQDRDSAEDSFGFVSSWADRAQPDPLAEGVGFDQTRLRFVAFLMAGSGESPPFPHVQGLVISCGHDQVAVPIGDPIPGTDGMTVDEIARAVVELPQPEISTADVVSVPYRLLVEGLSVGESWNTRQLTAEQVWQLAPDTELDSGGNEVFFEFNMPESSSCPYGPLTDIEYNPSIQRLYPVVPTEATGDTCTGDAGSHVIVVAISRSDLPPESFSIWVNGLDPPAGIGDGITFFEPGELNAPGELDLEHQVLGEDAELSVGETGIILDATTHCGFERLWWTIDGRQWVRTPGSSVSPPSSWLGVIRGESIDLVVERVEEDRLRVTARRTTESIDYVPAQDVMGCM